MWQCRRHNQFQQPIIDSIRSIHICGKKARLPQRAWGSSCLHQSKPLDGSPRRHAMISRAFSILKHSTPAKLNSRPAWLGLWMAAEDVCASFFGNWTVAGCSKGVSNHWQGFGPLSLINSVYDLQKSGGRGHLSLLLRRRLALQKLLTQEPDTLSSLTQAMRMESSYHHANVQVGSTVARSSEDCLQSIQSVLIIHMYSYVLFIHADWACDSGNMCIWNVFANGSGWSSWRSCLANHMEEIVVEFVPRPTHPAFYDRDLRQGDLLVRRSAGIRPATCVTRNSLVLHQLDMSSWPPSLGLRRLESRAVLKSHFSPRIAALIDVGKRAQSHAFCSLSLSFIVFSAEVCHRFARSLLCRTGEELGHNAHEAQAGLRMTENERKKAEMKAQQQLRALDSRRLPHYAGGCWWREADHPSRFWGHAPKSRRLIELLYMK